MRNILRLLIRKACYTCTSWAWFGMNLLSGRHLRTRYRTPMIHGKRFHGFRMCELPTSSDNESLSVSSLTDDLGCKRKKATIKHKKIKIFGDMMCYELLWNGSTRCLIKHTSFIFYSLISTWTVFLILTTLLSYLLMIIVRMLSGSLVSFSLALSPTSKIHTWIQ